MTFTSQKPTSECLIDFTGIEDLKLDDIGHEILRAVRQHTGVPISLGIGFEEHTADKIASKLCKQYPKLNDCWGIHRLADIKKVLREFPIGDVWSVVLRYEKMLLRNDVTTAWDFTQLTPEWERLLRQPAI